jgi:SAM-dependent methyltransferase
MSNDVKTKILHFLENPGLINRLGFRLWKASYQLRERVIPSWRRARMLDQEFDHQYGLETGDWINLGELKVSGENVQFGTHYEAITLSLFREAIAQIPEPLDDFLFIDFGSGKGRALLLAAEHPFGKITGVEFSSELNKIAQRNIERYKKSANSTRDIESICIDATAYPIPKEKSVCYFFNPFNEVVLAKVLGNIQKSIIEHPRTVYISYCNPIHIGVFNEFAFDKIAAGDKFALFKSRQSMV